MQSELQLATFVMLLLIMNGLNACVISRLDIESESRVQKVAQYGACMLVSLLLTWASARAFVMLQMGRAFLIIMLVLSAAYLAYSVYRLYQMSTDKKAFAIFITYTAMMLYITVLSRIGIHKDYIKMDLAHMLTNLVTQDSIKEIRHLGLNIAMFVPIGFFLPFCRRDVFRRFRYCSFGILLSASIEALQLMMEIGECDIADVIGNGLGMFLGIAAFRIYTRIRNRKAI